MPPKDPSPGWRSRNFKSLCSRRSLDVVYPCSMIVLVIVSMIVITWDTWRLIPLQQQQQQQHKPASYFVCYPFTSLQAHHYAFLTHASLPFWRGGLASQLNSLCFSVVPNFCCTSQDFLLVSMYQGKFDYCRVGLLCYKLMSDFAFFRKMRFLL